MPHTTSSIVPEWSKSGRYRAWVLPARNHQAKPSGGDDDGDDDAQHDRHRVDQDASYRRLRSAPRGSRIGWFAGGERQQCGEPSGSHACGKQPAMPRPWQDGRDLPMRLVSGVPRHGSEDAVCASSCSIDPAGPCRCRPGTLYLHRRLPGVIVGHAKARRPAIPSRTVGDRVRFPPERPNCVFLFIRRSGGRERPRPLTLR